VNRLGRSLRCLSLRSHDQTGLVYRTSRNRFDDAPVLRGPPARRALPAHSAPSLVPARRVPSLPLGQGFVSLRSLVPSRRPTGSSLRDIICSRFLIRRPSRWAERRLRRSTGLGDDKKDRRRTPRPLETPHRSGKHGYFRSRPTRHGAPCLPPRRSSDASAAALAAKSERLVRTTIRSTSRSRRFAHSRSARDETKSRHDLPPRSPRGQRIPRPLRGPVAPLRAQTHRHRHRRDRSPRTPGGVVPCCLVPSRHASSMSRRRCDHPRRSRLRRSGLLLGETVVAPRSLNEATVRTAMRLVAIVPVSRLRDAPPTGFASGRFAHSANKPPPGPSGSRRLRHGVRKGNCPPFRGRPFPGGRVTRYGHSLSSWLATTELPASRLGYGADPSDHGPRRALSQPVVPVASEPPLLRRFSPSGPRARVRSLSSRLSFPRDARSSVRCDAGAIRQAKVTAVAVTVACLPRWVSSLSA